LRGINAFKERNYAFEKGTNPLEVNPIPSVKSPGCSVKRLRAIGGSLRCSVKRLRAIGGSLRCSVKRLRAIGGSLTCSVKRLSSIMSVIKSIGGGAIFIRGGTKCTVKMPRF
jgi:hypothetical protein